METSFNSKSYNTIPRMDVQSNNQITITTSETDSKTESDVEIEIIYDEVHHQSLQKPSTSNKEFCIIQ